MEILISNKLVSMDVKNFYGMKNWAAIVGGENGESDDDFLQDSDSDKDYELDQFPPCDSFGDDSSDSGKFLYSYFEKGDQNELTLLFISTKILQHYLVTVFLYFR